MDNTDIALTSVERSIQHSEFKAITILLVILLLCEYCQNLAQKLVIVIQIWAYPWGNFGEHGCYQVNEVSWCVISLHTVYADIQYEMNISCIFHSVICCLSMQ